MRENRPHLRMLAIGPHELSLAMRQPKRGRERVMRSSQHFRHPLRAITRSAEGEHRVRLRLPEGHREQSGGVLGTCAQTGPGAANPHTTMRERAERCCA